MIESKYFKSELLQWIPVVVLGFSAFVYNTAEFIPIGLLLDISKDFNITESEAGLMVTIYAWIVAISSLPIILIFPKVERKFLLISIFIIFIFSHIISYMSSTYKILVLSRVFIAIAHSLFWSIVPPLAFILAPKGKHFYAISIISVGTSLAMGLGLPLGRFIGLYYGWRITFLSIGFAGAFMLLFIILFIPRTITSNSGSVESLSIIFKRKVLVYLFILNMIFVTAHFTVYSYIEPFLSKVSNMPNGFITIVLFVFGIMGIVGSIIFSKVKNKYPFFLLFIVVFILTLSIISIYFNYDNVYLLSIFLIFWGLSFAIYGLVMQYKVISYSYECTYIANAIYSGIFNLGIGSGALLGGRTIELIGLHKIFIVGFLLGILSLLILILFVRKQIKIFDLNHPKSK